MIAEKRYPGPSLHNPKTSSVSAQVLAPASVIDLRMPWVPHLYMEIVTHLSHTVVRTGFMYLKWIWLIIYVSFILPLRGLYYDFNLGQERMKAMKLHETTCYRHSEHRKVIAGSLTDGTMQLNYYETFLPDGLATLELCWRPMLLPKTIFHW